MAAPNTYASRLLVALAALALVPATARAQSVYEALFGYSTQRSPRLEYAPAPFVQPFFEVERSPVRLRAPARNHLALDEAASPPPVMPATAKPARVTPDKELVASIMADPTLRRGDIVVFPDGPRVYRGHGDSAKKPHDFEDLRASRLVGDSTRKVVLAASRGSDSPITTAATSKHRPSNRARVEDIAATGSIATGTAR